MSYFQPWLNPDNKQPFILVGPDGCGKGLLLRSGFQQLRSCQVATVHCSAQTTPEHVLQKLQQMCMVLNTNTGRVYRPKDCERLVLYLKDINLPKPDKWGTSQIIAFLQQVLTYNGFYDSGLEWVGLEGVQIVASMNGSATLGRHKLSTRFTSVVRICNIGYPDREQLQSIYSAYLTPVLQKQLDRHPVWSSSSKITALASSMVELYDQLRGRFSPDDHSHYLFTPRDLTRWILGLLRYDLGGGQREGSSDHVLMVWAYEARRLFRDRLVDKQSRDMFENILINVIRSDWSANIFDDLEDNSFVTWGSREAAGPGAPLPPYGKPLGKLGLKDLHQVIEKGLQVYSRDNRDLDLLLFSEVLDHVARVDRVLTAPGGSMLMAGRSGVGRRTAVTLVAHMHQIELHSPKVWRGYTVKHFKNDLKTVMQSAGIEGEQILLLLEDHQIVEPTFLELINSLLSAGEIPGLYSSEELDPLLAPLRDEMSEANFRGTLAQYFSSRVRTNLHVVLIMDHSNSAFTVNCESNPAFYKECSVQWMDSWSSHSMKKIPLMLLTRAPKDSVSFDKSKGRERKLSGGEKLAETFYHVHESVGASATPRRYMAFLHTYEQVYKNKKEGIETRQQHLKAGVSKLTEAKELVDNLKAKAAEQSEQLAEKQSEADAALKQITKAMQDAGDQKNEMEDLKQKVAEENKQLEKRKRAIDVELADIQPLVDQAKAAVGNIKSESLGEIRALRAPPETIRHILEAVLRVMGIYDTSWDSMRAFLAKRGVKDEISQFDARKITADIRKSCEDLLRKNKKSFEPATAKRASVAAAPLAEWVQANVQYSYVLEKIEPLEQEQAGLKKNLEKAESRMAKVGKALAEVDRKVAGFRDKFERTTTEAAKLKVELEKAQETISAAENLVGKLEGEYQRWNSQVGDMQKELNSLPMRALLAAAFITYLSAEPEDQRQRYMKHWAEMAGVDGFEVRRFLSSESELLSWKAEGLPSDDLSMENALIILQMNDIDVGNIMRPFLVDPTSRATEWLKTHMKENRLEVINQQDSNFNTQLELAVRFGKTLIIQEVDGVEPVLFPLLRGDLIAQGPRFCVQIGEKTIDYNEEFRLFLTTRNPNPEIPPDAASVVSEVDFTTTRAGLTGQLLAATIQHEKPELEDRKTELLRQEEDLKIQLAKLEDSLLRELASATGNILENKQLLDSLTQTKEKSAIIAESLTEAHRLQTSLDKERGAYTSLAENGSRLFFVIKDLCKINNMYRFSLAAFLRIFQRALKGKEEGSSTQMRIKTLNAKLQRMVYDYVCRSLFKADRLMFALHMVRGMHPKMFQENEWELFTGVIVADVKESAGSGVPSWIDEERHASVALLKATFSSLYQTLDLGSSDLWSQFSRSSQCEQDIPSSVEKKISTFQKVLLVQAVRPDRLQTAMFKFASDALGMQELSTPPVNLKRLYDQETLNTEPILIVISAGADPSQELRDLANQTIGLDKFHEVAMGQGQAEIAMRLLHECAQNGEWLCLKNLHLVTAWLPQLEKTLNVLKPHNNFRLWMTAEVHPKFPTILLQSSLKITFEAPPGVQKNLQRTYDSWSSDYVMKGGPLRANCMFALAWFHAVIQERRNFIPQGWTKFYEFSSADLRAAAFIIDRICQKTRGDEIKWNFVHGLFESAIYGGRVDNPFDTEVMGSYLRQYFNDRTIYPSGRDRRLGPLKVPSNPSYQEFVGAIKELPEFDKPKYFGLPENIERSSQRIISAQVISQLRILMRGDVKASRFDKEVWAKELGPILNLWKKLNQGSNLIHARVAPPGEKSSQSPILSFILLERYNAIKLVQSIHQSLASLSKVIRGTMLLSKDVQKLAEALLQQETPLEWLSKCDGPEDPIQYLRSAVSRTNAIGKWAHAAEAGTLLQEKLDLSDLFHPDTFLNALRQQTARELRCSMNELKFVCSWRSGVSGARLPIKLGNLQLEGCSFDGSRLSENQRDSPSVSGVPSCSVAWMPLDAQSPYRADEVISLPVYYSPMRDRIVARIDVPCGSDKGQWIQCGAALFLREI